MPFGLTASRCETSPPDDTPSNWNFSGYCQALHKLHLVNFPGQTTGGGALEGVFVLPVLVTIAGAALWIRPGSIRPLKRALITGGVMIALLTIAAFVFATTTLRPQV